MAMSPSGPPAAAILLASDESYLADFPFPDFEGGFTPWGDYNNNDDDSTHHDYPMYMPNFLQTCHHQSQLPSPVSPNSGLDEPQSCPPQHLPPPDSAMVDERKQRRMISNRLSARRSRMRKQEQLDNLRNLENQLRVQNRDITNRLGFARHRSYLLRRDNDRLRSESIALRRRLSDISRILTLRQLQHHLFLSSSSPSPSPSPSSQCNSFSSTNEVNEQSQLPSLIA